MFDEVGSGFAYQFAGMLTARRWAGFLRAAGRGVGLLGQAAGRGSAARRSNALAAPTWPRIIRATAGRDLAQARV
ncbi:hypothetical protein DLJ60_08805 [Micromonospora chalcea]|uniref:Uncharacterized protein n=1 Tax=Micromonospora chalcea TaxID=1874 RepID=A0ABX9Y6C6_MICCH|nr:hypothetical protein A8711_20845 [Micromonospora sp. II]RQW94613.1 hypothetical protein DLJ60_08805 [Micromonospora chalcea]RQX29569.1 hypothetical protein DLJ57_21975 [Micromonospora chalcea]